MTKFMKRIGTVLLCFCMLMPMVPETALAAEIDYVDITIESPLVGTGSREVEAFVPNASSYDVEEVTTHWLDASGGAEAVEFSEGDRYISHIKITPTGSDTFGQTTVVRVNGSDDNCHKIETDGGNYGYITIEYTTNAEMLGVVEEVELTGLPTGAIGDTADPYNYDGIEYSVIGTWMVYNPTTQLYEPMQNTDVFQQGKIYQLVINATTKPGYIFDEETQLIIDGENVSYDNRNSFNMHKTIYESHLEEIDEINMLSANYPKAEVGKTFTDTELDIAVPAGSHYKASGHWVYMDENGNEFTEGTFESGKAYYLRISIVPEDGYAFAEDAELYIDEEPHWIEFNPASIEYEERVSFKEKIGKVTLLNLPVATVGGTAKTGEFEVEVPADANYTATAIWIEGDSNSAGMLTEPVFKENKIYTLDVNIVPKEGYEFAETLYINAYGIERKETYVEPEWTWFSKEFSFLKEIAKVEITGYTEPKVGDNVAENLAGLKVPAGANYVLEQVSWIDMANYQEATTFEKGHDYMLELYIVPKEDYGFTNSTKVSLNGENIFISIDDPVWLNVNKTVSFREVITDVQVTNIPTMEIGKTAAADVKVPDGAKYSATALWRVWDDTKQEYVAFEGTFEKGKVYELGVIVLPNEGYRFSEDDTKFQLDGKEVEPSEIITDRIIYNKGYQTEHKVIERVELKIEEPVIGNHSSIPPVITIVGDANFTVIDEEMMLQWIYETPDGWLTADYEYFIADKTYGVYFMIQANEGYVFADDLVIVINGKVIPEDAYTKALKLGDVAYIFGTGTEEVKDEPVTAPKTGDDSQIGLWVAVFMMGIFACSNALMERKRR